MENVYTIITETVLDFQIYSISQSAVLEIEHLLRSLLMGLFFNFLI